MGRIAPFEATDVAMSSTTGASLPAGIATAIGLVPSNGSAPPHGAMKFDADTALNTPTMPCASGIAA